MIEVSSLVGSYFKRLNVESTRLEICGWLSRHSRVTLGAEEEVETTNEIDFTTEV